MDKALGSPLGVPASKKKDPRAEMAARIAADSRAQAAASKMASDPKAQAAALEYAKSGKIDSEVAEDLANNPAVQEATRKAAMEAANDPKARAAAMSYGKNMLSGSKFGGMFGMGQGPGDDVDANELAESRPLMEDVGGGGEAANDNMQARAQEIATGKAGEAKAMATAKAAEATKRVQGAMKERLGANAHVFTEGGMPDKEKIKHKAQDFLMGGISRVTSMFGEGGKYEELGDEMINDFELEGMEMADHEYEVPREGGADPWLASDAELDAIGVFDDKYHIRQKLKAEQLLEDVQFKQIMYALAGQYYSRKNRQFFIIPTILLTSFSSFFSFAAATSANHARMMSLMVGFMGTVATLLTSLRSQYNFDQRSEQFRTAAKGYRTISQKLKGKLRKDEVTIEAWDQTWKDIEYRLSDVASALVEFPPARLVERWIRLGNFIPIGDNKHGTSMPPWVAYFEDALVEHGIQTAEDVEFISEDVFKELDADERLPPVVVKKLKDMKNVQLELRICPGDAFGLLPPVGIQISRVPLKASTQEAFYRRGVDHTNKLRLASNKVLDLVLNELIEKGTAPFPDQWQAIEEASCLLKKHGELGYPIMRKLWKGGCIRVELDERAVARIERCKLADQVEVDGRILSKASLVRVSEEYKNGGGNGGAFLRANRKTNDAVLPVIAEPAREGSIKRLNLPRGVSYEAPTTSALSAQQKKEQQFSTRATSTTASTAQYASASPTTTAKTAPMNAQDMQSTPVATMVSPLKAKQARRPIEKRS